MSVTFKMTCKAHKTYKAKRKPSSRRHCEACHFIYETKAAKETDETLEDLEVERVDD